MRKLDIRKVLIGVGVAIAAATFPLKAMAASFEALNVFGDSLVDSGNLFNLTSTLTQGALALPPSPPYAQRFSNGPIWIDNVGQALGLSPTLSTQLVLDPTTPPPTQGVSFAFGGALSSNANVLDNNIPALAPFLPGFQEQIASFTALSATLPVNPKALNVIWVGGNDYNEAFSRPSSSESSLTQLPNAVTDNIVGGLSQLSNLGAKDFLVVNLPALGDAPFAKYLDAQTQQDVSSQLNDLATAHNSLLATKLSAFGQSHKDVNIATLDVGSLFADVTANPAAFGLTNVSDPCLTNFQPGFQFDGVCANPDQYLFWDNVHPTTAAYKLVSNLALATLEDKPSASVPEPNSVGALLLIGLVGAASVLAKRQNASITHGSGEPSQ